VARCADEGAMTVLVPLLCTVIILGVSVLVMIALLGED
jgi:hypothetical protein